MELTAAVPVIEYRVQTACGRNFVWSSPSEDSLKRELAWKGYQPLLIMENAAFEAMEEENERKLQQQAYVIELNRAIEQEEVA